MNIKYDLYLYNAIFIRIDLVFIDHLFDKWILMTRKNLWKIQVEPFYGPADLAK